MTSSNNNKDNLSEQSRAEQSRAELRTDHKNSYSDLSRKFKHIRVFTVILAIIVLIGALGAGYCGLKLYNKVQNNATTINSLQSQLIDFQSRLEAISPSLNDEEQKFIDNCDESHYNILFIGNSITRHGLADYWWSENRGMAASEDSKDYVHVVKSELGADAQTLKTLKPSATAVNCYAKNYYEWEKQSKDRAETYSLIDKYFSNGNNIDCVVLQLGENCDDTSTLESDYEALVNHIKNLASNSKILIVGEFWRDPDKDSAKKQAVSNTDTTFIDLSPIQDDPAYQAGKGTEVLGDDGTKHAIEHDGVAGHPGDKGMEWIAKAVVEGIEK